MTAQLIPETEREKWLWDTIQGLRADKERLTKILEQRDTELAEVYDENYQLKKQNAIHKDFPEQALRKGRITQYEVNRTFYELGVKAERNKVILHD